MQEGWILLHRKLQECEIWANSQPFDMRSAWVDLLLLANHKDAEIVFDYKPMTVKRGQYLTSVRKLSARWSWSKDRTLKYLKLLESLGMIHRDSTNQRTLITIDKYDVYQNEQDTDKDTKRTRVRTRVGHETDTSKDTGSPQTINDNNDNNDNNDKEDNPYNPLKYFPNDEKLDQAFIDYVNMRKQIKKPMTDKAIELAIKKINELSNGDNDKAIAILNQSIMNSWQGLFPLKNEPLKSKWGVETVDWNKV